MNKVLLDTSVIIDFLRNKKNNYSLLEHVADQKCQPFISIITHTELYAGKSIWKSNNSIKELELVLSGLLILDLQKKISKTAGELRASYNIGIADAIIAATAIHHNLPLTTLNTKDFENIKGIKLLK